MACTGWTRIEERWDTTVHRRECDYGRVTAIVRKPSMGAPYYTLALFVGDRYISTGGRRRFPDEAATLRSASGVSAKAARSMGNGR